MADSKLTQLTEALVSTASDLVYIVTGGNSKSITLANLMQNIATSIIPGATNTYDLGSASSRFRDLYLSGSTMYLGNATIRADAGGNVTIGGANVVQSGAPSNFVLKSLPDTTLSNANAIAQVNFGRFDANGNIALGPLVGELILNSDTNKVMVCISANTFANVA